MISPSGPSLPSRPVGASRSVMTTSGARSRSSGRPVIRSSAAGPPRTSTTRPAGAADPAGTADASGTAEHFPQRSSEPVGGAGVPDGDADPARRQAGEGLTTPDREATLVQAGPHVREPRAPPRQRPRPPPGPPDSAEAGQTGHQEPAP